MSEQQKPIQVCSEADCDKTPLLNVEVGSKKHDFCCKKGFQKSLADFTASMKITTRPEDFDVQKLIDYLQGTCNSLSDGIETIYPGMDDMDLIQEDYDTMDNQIFHCETCGWWCESHEQQESGECEDCAVEEDEDEFDEDDVDEDGNSKDDED